MARRFPTFHRYSTREPVLIIAKVQRHKIIAYKPDYSESEVITKGVDYFAFEDLRFVV